MNRNLDLSEVLKRCFENHRRDLKRQLNEIEGDNAKAQCDNFTSAQKVAELKRRISFAEEHRNEVLMTTRKGTFGEAQVPICPVCLIDHKKISLLEEFGNRFTCRKCGLVVEAES